MEHAAQARIVAHDAQAVAVRLPVVDNDREVQLQRKLQLRAQHGLLRCLRGGVPVIVQTDLADGADLGLRCQRADLIQTVVRPTGGLLRMPADGSINKIIRLRDGNGARGRHGTVTWVHDERDAALVHSAQHIAAVGVELSAVVVRVGIEILRHSA